MVDLVGASLVPVSLHQNQPRSHNYDQERSVDA